MDLSNIVVCSFYTTDPYYTGHADVLRQNLDRIGVAHELLPVTKPEGLDWADMTRKKIPFLARVCEENPGKKVFWIDVDCSLLSLPENVANFSSDIIGFQRGFGSPLTIGYANRTRFWEPCFFGINTTPMARKFISDAALLEKSAQLKATDDYFFEESWRSNAPNMSFQVIPSLSVVSRATGEQDVPAFFSFGSSGNVEEFKHKVVQHDRIGSAAGSRVWPRLRRRALRTAKAVERRLPDGSARRIRLLADKVGVTHVLTAAGSAAMPSGVGSPHRAKLVRELIASGQRGEGDRVTEVFERLSASGIPSKNEIAAKRAADAFAHYASRRDDAPALDLVWWPRPFPGNFGDWLSPLVFAGHSDRSIRYIAPTAPNSAPHLVSVGSIGRFIKPSSIVVGTGVSSEDIDLESKAHYISVRGPITADLLRRSGGPTVTSFGDPGVLLRRLLPVERTETNGRVALVRHFTHANLPLALPDTMDELSVLLSHPDQVETFVRELNQYDSVVTSAMHVMITCHSYGIPCALVTFEGLESSVHGTGIKYRDYSLGAELEAVHEPVVVSGDLRRLDLDAITSLERVSDAKLDEVETAVKDGIADYLARLA